MGEVVKFIGSKYDLVEQMKRADMPMYSEVFKDGEYLGCISDRIRGVAGFTWGLEKPHPGGAWIFFYVPNDGLGVTCAGDAIRGLEQAILYDTEDKENIGIIYEAENKDNIGVTRNWKDYHPVKRS